jgi:hypothetical protein
MCVHTLHKGENDYDEDDDDDDSNNAQCIELNSVAISYTI